MIACAKDNNKNSVRELNSMFPTTGWTCRLSVSSLPVADTMGFVNFSNYFLILAQPIQNIEVSAVGLLNHRLFKPVTGQSI